MTGPSADRVVADLLSKLRTPRVTYFPIRHHSPACAAHLKRWITANRPASVLVEGPPSFTAKIPLLVDERCVCPVAIYATFVDKRGRLIPPGDGDAPSPERAPNPCGPPRFAAFYPFCDYSPELVALRGGRDVGARLRFIDLEYPEMILARSGGAPAAGDVGAGVRVDSLAADEHLFHSEYVRALARQIGCRDFNEAWDHLFEAGAEGLDTDRFIDRVAAYCALARLGYRPETLARDGTVARERRMADAITEELRRNAADGRTGPVLVVTGGFHTAALPDLVAAETAGPKPLDLTEDESGSWLMRYSFDRLDALAGYASGMPSPGYYEQLWRAPPDRRPRAVADLIVEIGRQARHRHLGTISTPDAIAAVQMAQQLASLRGHPWPLREDVLDGVRACFIKGEIGPAGDPIMHLVREMLAGTRVGDVPPDAGMPPIVDDFRREAKRFRLPIESVEKRELALDLYRNATHRQISRLLHRLALLSARFAGLIAGPDFVHGYGLELIQERWEVCWSPATESGLIEAAVYGPTVEAAAGAKLRERIDALADEANARNTSAAVQLLIHACRLGLHAQAAGLVPLIDGHIAEDPSFPSVVGGLAQLELLAHAREPLEAGSLTALARLTADAYRRACRLLDDIAHTPEDTVTPVIEALQSLREVLAGADPEAGLDRALMTRGLTRIVAEPPQDAHPAVVGAAAGVLYGEGELSEDGLVRVALGYLGGSVRDPKRSCGLLRGLLATAREAAWHVEALTRALDAQFQSWDETTFLDALPELRLAFTGLTPQEVVQVADRVAGLHGEHLGDLIMTDVDESDARFGFEITRRVRESLQADGLTPFSDRETPHAPRPDEA